VDDRPHLNCCQTADDEAIEYEAETFDCEACPLLAMQDGLRPENVEAWRIFQVLVTRFTVDVGVAGQVFQGLMRDWLPDEVEDMTARLSILYDLLIPPPTPKAG